MYILRITFKSIQKPDKLKIKNINQLKNIQINGIFNIKNKKKIFTLLKSPHVNKKSREHFIYKNYTKKIDLNFFNIFQLINFLILFKKKFSNKFLIKIKILKKNICL